MGDDARQTPAPDRHQTETRQTPDRHLRCAEEEMNRMKRKNKKENHVEGSTGLYRLKENTSIRRKRKKYCSKGLMFKWRFHRSIEF